MGRSYIRDSLDRNLYEWSETCVGQNDRKSEMSKVVLI